MMRKLVQMVVAAVAVLSTTAAPAALYARPGGMVYDDVLKITWLSDWNYAETSGYATTNAGGSGYNTIWSNGQMGWDAAMDWADNLVYGGFDDWRLPTALNANGTGPCSGGNCTGSEMGHMFYNNWSATSGNDFSAGANTANLALFSNVQSDIPDFYWSGTEEKPYSSGAWVFLMSDGQQDVDFDKSWGLYAVAVRPGDVPEPQTLALALLALVLAVVVRRKAN